jgi:nicotinamide-nucleotide amidase
MRASILTIGTEITRGELIDTNGAWLSEQLSLLGFEVVEHVSVPDDGALVSDTFLRLCLTSDVLVCTGGLGPTSDDLTASSVAHGLGKSLVRDEESLARITARYRSFGSEMSEDRAKQADLPEGARVLGNQVGTAPGFCVTHEGCDAFFTPGVPREMKSIFMDSVRPSIAPRVIKRTYQEHIRSFGLTESDVAERLADLDGEGMTLGYRVSFPEIEVKIFVEAESELLAEREAKRLGAAARARLGDYVYGGRDDTFPSAVGRALRDNGLTLAVAESCTGGLIGSMLTSVPGSSEFFLLDAIVYSNRAKERVLDVSIDLLRAHGAVSEECALAMADGVRSAVAADLAVSVTGIAGPGGGSDDKPVGTVCFGISRKGKVTRTERMLLRGDRARIQRLASYIALRLILLEIATR